ncbi:energy-coupling factor transporter transmembrane component T family protein [Rothia sp. P13129]|uniref:energy-coupling factor transporter transmembrane component T family protein n=1 Tax=Rothia sp. P13129 TaxID=3402664 RepID=UPI003AD6224C
MSFDIFASTAEKEGILGSVNAGVKVALTLLLTIILILLKDWVSITIIFCIELVGLWALGLNPVRLLGQLWPVLFGVLLSGWSTALLVEKTGTMLFDMGFLSMSTGSLVTGIVLTIRGLAMVLPGMMLMLTTDPTDIADSLAQSAKLPVRFVLGALVALRLVGLLLSEWNTLGQARRARGLGSEDTLWQRVKTFCGQSFALLVQAIRRGTRLSITMEARGFGSASTRTWARIPQYSLVDVWFTVGVVLTVLAGVLGALGAGTLTFIWQ